MKVDIDKLLVCLTQLEESYPEKLQLVLGRTAQFNEGFLYALGYMRKYVVPAIEEEEQMEKASALFALYEELEALKILVGQLEKEFKELKDGEGESDAGPDI